MRTSLPFLQLFTGCIEYEPSYQLDDVVVPHPRALDNQERVDRIVQTVVPQVDVLWVVDNSSSMSDEQDELVASFPVFLDFFLGSGLDYHIGVVSTDMEAADQRGKLQVARGNLWVSPDTVDAHAVLSEMTLLGTQGSGQEMGRDPIFAAIEVQSGGANLGFYREDASLHTVVISDEEDQSTDMPIGEFVEWMKNLKASDDDTSFSAIASPDSSCGNTVGNDYMATVDAVGGIFWSICTTSWNEVLERLGLQAAGLRREYFLSDLPVEDSIAVWVETEGVVFAFDVGADYLYDAQRNSIVFSTFVPAQLSEVFVSYDLLASAETGI
jgi:hypothetical protein